jgi:hypothetical protein
MKIKKREFREIALRFIEIQQTAYSSHSTFIQEFHYHTPVFLGCKTKPSHDYFAGAKSNPMLLRV